MRSGEAIKKMWKEDGIDYQNKHMVFFCGSGWRAAETTWEAWLMGYDVPPEREHPSEPKSAEGRPTIPPGFIPLPKMKKVPLIGAIACGDPITAIQNREGDAEVPEDVRCDFALKCKGESMIGAGIHDGDVVYIRIQPEVENGEIAAVRIGGEATLKHFHRQGDAVMLLADNAAVCPPMIFTGLQLEELHIEGRAVGLCRGL